MQETQEPPVGAARADHLHRSEDDPTVLPARRKSTPWLRCADFPISTVGSIETKYVEKEGSMKKQLPDEECPACGSTTLRFIPMITQPDNWKLKKVQCAACLSFFSAPINAPNVMRAEVLTLDSV